MKDKIIELLEEAAEKMDCPQMDEVADYLISKGVTILPEGAIILTRAEIDALNKYESKIKNKWISVEDRLPEVGDDYLVTIKMKYAWETEWEYHTDVATWGCGPEDAWCTLNDWCEGQEVHITHWMPLPDPCESEEER